MSETASPAELRAYQDAAIQFERRTKAWAKGVVNDIELRKFCVQHCRPDLPPEEILRFLTMPLRDSPTDKMSHELKTQCP